MAQTTSAETFTDAYIAQSTDGSTWVDISGYSNRVSLSGGERQTGTAYTADGDTAIIKAGKRQPITVTVQALYTETANEAYDESNDAYEGASAYYLRWAPDGNASGNLQYTTSVGIVKNPVYPQGDAASGDPIAIDIVVECASVTEATIA